MAYTDIFQAIRLGGPENIQEFITKNRDSINQYDASGKTPLFFALSQRESIDKIRTLILNGADVNLPSTMYGTPLSPLHYALSARARTNSSYMANKGLRTGLLQILNQHDNIISLLLDQGASKTLHASFFSNLKTSSLTNIRNFLRLKHTSIYDTDSVQIKHNNHQNYWGIQGIPCRPIHKAWLQEEKCYEAKLAFCGTLHNRLGLKSPACALSPILISSVFQHLHAQDFPVTDADIQTALFYQSFWDKLTQSYAVRCIKDYALTFVEIGRHAYALRHHIPIVTKHIREYLSPKSTIETEFGPAAPQPGTTGLCAWLALSRFTHTRATSSCIQWGKNLLSGCTGLFRKFVMKNTVQ